MTFANDYLQEMASPGYSPSGTTYVLDGKPVTSLGVFKHWDGDETRRYSRNKDPQTGRGIELIHLPAKA